MNDIELLDLIAKGETEALLLQNDLTVKLNALAAKGLVDICEGRIVITSKGENFQKRRPVVLPERTKIQKDMEGFSSRSLKRNSMYAYLCLILLFSSVFYLITIVINN